MNENQPARREARDRAVRRASRTTGWAAIGGVAATAVAAVVFAQSSASAAVPVDAGATASSRHPAIRGGLVAPPNGPQASDTTGSGAGSGPSLQPPAAAPQASSGGHAHTRSGAS
jgi:hypothetical protein